MTGKADEPEQACYITYFVNFLGILVGLIAYSFVTYKAYQLFK